MVSKYSTKQMFKNEIILLTKFSKLRHLSYLVMTGFFMLSATHAKSYQKNCFTEHILESIHINKERKKHYSELTDGASDRIFNLLIGYEYLTLVPAKFFDLKAKPYQKKGMELFCHEFVSMDRAPSFDPNKKIFPSEKMANFSWRDYKEKISDAIKRDDIESASNLLISGMLELKDMPHYYCMTRHLLESIYRFAYFIPIREEEAYQLGIKSPRKMMKNVMKAHLLGLRDSIKIDKWSYPIQKNGIPLLCSELPNLLLDLNAPELEVLKGGH